MESELDIQYSYIIPAYVCKLIQLVKPPRPRIPKDYPMWFGEEFLALNTLMLDEQRIVIEKDQLELQKFFEDLGFKCIKVPFNHAFAFGGGFHCYTSEIRRKGTLESYF